ncbi:hypothetical protein Ancab_028594 [Ancistrocladus abbreviatus]
MRIHYKGERIESRWKVKVGLVLNRPIQSWAGGAQIRMMIRTRKPMVGNCIVSNSGGSRPKKVRAKQSIPRVLKRINKKRPHLNDPAKEKIGRDRNGGSAKTEKAEISGVLLRDSNIENRNRLILHNLNQVTTGKIGILGNTLEFNQSKKII